MVGDELFESITAEIFWIRQEPDKFRQEPDKFRQEADRFIIFYPLTFILLPWFLTLMLTYRHA